MGRLCGKMAATMRAFLLLLAAFAAHAETPASGVLTQAIGTVDAEAFDAFNRCAEPGQLEKHASYFAKDVEFYHDDGGVTWTREEMLANTRKFACGKFRRELVSMKVFPVKDFGAIATGTHRFCQFASGRCDGEADFAIVWREQAGQWTITRVLSYGHRPRAGADRDSTPAR